MLGMLLPSGYLLASAASGSIIVALARAAGVTSGRLAGRGKGKRMKLDKNTAVGVAAKTMCLAGADLYLKPGINANIRHYLDFSEKTYDAKEAKQAAELLAVRLGDIRPGRIGVDGLPGSGKSTLARALAEQMGMGWVCLDHQLSTKAPIDLSRPDMVYEHHRLFRTQVLDQFDFLIYLDEPLETVEKQILDRGRGAAMLEVFDFAKMQAVGRKAFEIADGETWRVPQTNILVKRQPPEGFKEREHLEEEVKGMGFSATENLPKEALLFLATFGKAKDGALAYLHVERLFGEIVNTVARATLGPARF
ncbi:hypothetical protein ACFL1X_09645 [Candidatus Hydrogenedentota bacterium]